MCTDLRAAYGVGGERTTDLTPQRLADRPEELQVIQRRLRFVLVATILTFGLVPGVPAQAHGAGVVKSCISGTDCTTKSANNAVFAVCDPLSATTTCDPGRDVTIQVANFGKGVTVHLWWLNGEVEDQTRSDCLQAIGELGRTHLGDVTTDSVTGKASLDVHLPPGGGTPDSWSYGDNWLCGTTAPHTGGSGTIGNQLFTIYPVYPGPEEVFVHSY